MYGLRTQHVAGTGATRSVYARNMLRPQATCVHTYLSANKKLDRTTPHSDLINPGRTTEIRDS